MQGGREDLPRELMTPPLNRTATFPTRAVAVVASVLLVGAVVIGFFYHERLAAYAWHRFGNADLALLLRSDDTEILLDLGNYFFGGQGAVHPEGAPLYNLPKAKRAFTRAVALEPTPMWGHYQLARVYFVEKDSARALMEISRELELFPYNKRALYIRGLIYGFRNEEGDLERAERDFREFIAWAPTEWAGYNDLMWILLKREDYASVKDIGERAFKLVPDAEENPWLVNSIGVAYLNLKEYQDAEVFLVRALAAAERLGLSEWVAAYSANDPVIAAEGKDAFIKGIKKNLAVARFFMR